MGEVEEQKAWSAQSDITEPNEPPRVKEAFAKERRQHTISNRKSADSDVRSLRVESLIWLLCSVCILLAGGLLAVESDGRVSLKVAILGEQVLLPETCTMNSRFGVECPGCGLTRSFIHIVHGRLIAAWSTNWVGFLMFAFTCIQIPISLLHAMLPQGKKAESLAYRWLIWGNERAVFALVGVLVVRWLIRLSM